MPHLHDGLIVVKVGHRAERDPLSLPRPNLVILTEADHSIIVICAVEGPRRS